MGQGGFIFAELDSVKRQYPDFARAFADLELHVIDKCDADWKTWAGRTTILPPLFRGFGQTAATPPVAGTNCLQHFRQHLTSTGQQTLLTGALTGNVIPEDFKIAWMGLAFPNKQMNISELKWQISDGKYVRVNIEELMSYDKPALIFEKGYIINEKESFDFYGNVENADYQRIVPLGACYYRVIDRVLGAPGSAIA